MKYRLFTSRFQFLEEKISGIFVPGAGRNKLTGNSSRGFTIVEMIISSGLFAIVMLVAIGALLALVDANRKARSLQSVVNNLNVALDGMVRATRMGQSYHCGSVGTITDVHDCISGDVLVAFQPYCSSGSCDPNGRWIYQYDATAHRLKKSENNGTTWFYVTASEVSIDAMKFYVVGTTPGDATQPKVVVVLQGTAGANNTKTRTTFSIQSTAVQRVLDI